MPGPYTRRAQPPIRAFHSRQEPHKFPTGPDPLLDVMCWCGNEMVKVKRSLVQKMVTGECGEDCYMAGTMPDEVRERIEAEIAEKAGLN